MTSDWAGWATSAALGVALGLVGPAAHSAAQSAPEAAIKANGIVRVCDANGEEVNSDGDQYGLEGNQRLIGPPPGFDNFAYACRGRPQTFETSQIADPGRAPTGKGLQVKSTVSINVDFQPQFTEVLGQSAFTLPVCMAVGPGAPLNPGFPRIAFVAQATADRSIPATGCIDDLGEGPGEGPCSSVRARLGLGNRGFLDRHGNVVPYFEFVELTAPHLADPDGYIRLRQVAKLIPGLGGVHVEGRISAMLLTAVAGTPQARAAGDVRILMETQPWVYRVACPFSTDVTAVGDAPLEFLPKPDWWIDAGDAIPDDFTLAISPPTGPLTLSQAFDLSVMAATSGATITGIAGNIDGQDVSGPLAGCLQPTAALTGVQGAIFTCRGLSGGFLASIFGTGAHTLSVTMALSDGRTITNSATWTIRP